LKIKSVILLLGGNQGDVSKTLAASLAIIEKDLGSIVSVSHIYQTKAWGPIPQGDFLNIAIKIKSALPASLIMKKLLDIEKAFGRRRDVKYGPRTLDIDMLFYGNQRINNLIVNIPHPEIQNRRFVLQPCTDIIPKYIHPVLKQNILKLLAICPDQLEVKQWKM